NKHAYQLMRQSHGAEGKDESRPLPHFGRQAVGASDHEGERRRALVAPAGKCPGETLAVEGLAAFVEGDGNAVTDALQQRDAFLPAAILLAPGAALRHFGQVERRKAERTRARADALLIALDQRPLRPRLATAAGRPRQAHGDAQPATPPCRRPA